MPDLNAFSDHSGDRLGVLVESDTFQVEAEDEWSERILQAVERGKPQPSGYSFTAEEDLLDILTANRFAILEALTGAGPLGVRELARRVGRDVRALHADAARLASIGLIDKTANGKLHFPYQPSAPCLVIPGLAIGADNHAR